MTSGGKQSRKGVPYEEYADAGKGYGTKDDGKRPVGPVKSNIHRSLLPEAQKETVKGSMN